MDVRSKSGDKIIFSNPTAGMKFDQDLASEYLKIGETYTIAKINIQNWRTGVWLTEITGVQSFNSVMFENTTE